MTVHYRRAARQTVPTRQPRATICRAIVSEAGRLRGSALIPIHAVCGLAAGIACGAYFAAAPYDPGFGTDAFFQILGAFMPLMVAIIVALNIETEREAGDMANLLGVPSRRLGLTAKIMVLWILGLLALVLAALAFRLPMALAGRAGTPVSALALAILGIAGGSLCLYLLAIALAMRFGRNLTIAVGVVGTGTAIGSLGGLLNGLYSHTLAGAGPTGVSRWIPFTWPARFGSLGIEQALALTMPGGDGLRVSIGVTALDNLVPCLDFTLALAVALMLWIGWFEDRHKSSD